MANFQLEQYLSDSMAGLVKSVFLATRQNPKASAFFAKYAFASKKAERIRSDLLKNGEHIPLFLIASITSSCNLLCRGCYDRVRAYPKIISEAPEKSGVAASARIFPVPFRNLGYAPNTARVCHNEMTLADWCRIFCEAETAGVSAILLAGGEPLMRFDVVEEAAKHPAILFPVFTNGTLFNEKHCALFESFRNLVPIISIEGDSNQTDDRRGKGVYEKTKEAMGALAKDGLLFGVSITVTNENLASVTDQNFVGELKASGCRAIIFVEYVPIEESGLALDDSARLLLDERVGDLRKQEDMIIISFPGDEKESGGCLAAGRGFFHINAAGGAEPCPFSPYSDTSLKSSSLREALRSPLFTRLREDGYLSKEHSGGCVLFGQEPEVKSLAQQTE
ncbi:MAG: radical SAM protein [Clostridiales bacterium]|nr:radical SAM protein [Clostridiales bacterium]